MDKMLKGKCYIAPPATYDVLVQYIPYASTSVSSTLHLQQHRAPSASAYSSPASMYHRHHHSSPYEENNDNSMMTELNNQSTNSFPRAHSNHSMMSMDSTITAGGDSYYYKHHHHQHSHQHSSQIARFDSMSRLSSTRLSDRRSSLISRNSSSSRRYSNHPAPGYDDMISLPSEDPATEMYFAPVAFSPSFSVNPLLKITTPSATRANSLSSLGDGIVTAAVSRSSNVNDRSCSESLQSFDTSDTRGGHHHVDESTYQHLDDAPYESSSKHDEETEIEDDAALESDNEFTTKLNDDVQTLYPGVIYNTPASSSSSSQQLVYEGNENIHDYLQCFLPSSTNSSSFSSHPRQEQR
jgi:hypothetical protein